MSYLKRSFALKKSREFETVYKKGLKWHSNSLISFFLQSNELKIGFSVSKKVGKAVVRNKIKRRLRAALLDIKCDMKVGHYVVVPKKEILDSSYKKVVQDFEYCIRKLNSK